MAAETRRKLEFHSSQTPVMASSSHSSHTVEGPIRGSAPRFEPDTRLITINVNTQTQGRNVYGDFSFRMKRCTPLNKLITSFYESKNMEPRALRFLLDGHQIQPQQTPQELDIEDGDEIDAMLDMEGGATLA